MQTLEGLSAQLETTQDIRAIVRVMKALSSARIRSYETAVEAIGEYERAVELGLQAVLREGGAGDLRARAAGGGAAFLVIGSDRGLCGRFNDRIAGFAAERLRAAEAGGGPPPVVAVAGVRAAARLGAAGRPAETAFALPASVDGLAEVVRALVVEMRRWTESGRVGTVTVLFNRRRGAALAEPAERRLLPIPRSRLETLARAPWPSRSRPVFRMERGALLSSLIRQSLFVALYRALAESLASEHAARLAAMQGAERAIDERREALEGAYRRKRQETITRELLDVVSGFEATRDAD